MWTHENIKRVLLDLSLLVNKRSFLGVNDHYKKYNQNWKNDIGLDSIEVMELASYVNFFFDIFEYNNPPYLLSSFEVDDWVVKIFNIKNDHPTYLNFKTSGTTGISKSVKHSEDFINREVEYLSTLFEKPDYIIPYVPSYNIYGYLFTVGLSNRFNIPVKYPSEVDWLTLSPNSLVVATPFHWKLLLEQFGDRHIDCQGVSSGSILYNSLYHSLLSRNIVLTEIYGSTETGGVGFRRNENQDFSLFPYWDIELFTNMKILRDSVYDKAYPLMDEIKVETNNKFSIIGRKDKQIKIAGNLVDLDRIKVKITGMANIRSCSISVKKIIDDIQIECEIILIKDGIKERKDITDYIRSSFPAHEVPRNIYFC